MRSARAGAAPIDKADAKANTLIERSKTDMCCPIAALRDARAVPAPSNLNKAKWRCWTPLPCPDDGGRRTDPAFAVG
ncbi:hypothetical protein [Methylocystis rosea]|uniref:hypothetical protein n=1 Tax=Methylocystis rosea TaxID=173366 RepID=UPI0018A6C187|nr:hypothetical protein [Methylocystis rosea]